ncbi:hypothetical protein JCM11641_007052 [Rhodosporidiobolus odoratus]
MASYSSFDDSQDSNLPTSTPHRTLGLKSFAQTFNQDDYEQPPPGIDQRDWARLARQNGRRDDTTAEEGDSLLDETAPSGGGQSGGEGASQDDERAPREYQAQRAQTATRSTRSRTTSALSSRTANSASSVSRHPSASTNLTSPSPYDQSHEPDTTLRSDAPDHDQSTSTEIDQTQTTELLSARLGGAGGEDTTMASSAASDVYGGGGRPAKKRSSGGGMGQNMTLREQEKVIDELKKDNFSLKLKLHFYEQRLEKMAPSSVEQALRENIQLKVEFQTLRPELKRYKKLLLEGNKVIEDLTRQRDELEANAASRGGSRSARERELEKELKRLRERDQDHEEWERKAREPAREVKQLKARGVSSEELEDLRADNDDLRRHLQDAEDEREELRQDVSQLRREVADRADQSMVSDAGRTRGTFRREVERLEQESSSLRSQVSAQLTMLTTRNDEKQHLQVQVEELKADCAALENELDHAQRERERSREERAEEGDRGDLADDLNRHRDRATALSLELEDTKTQLDAKEREIEELLAELDERAAQHDDDVAKVEGEWRDEVERARAAEAEAKQLLEDKEADVDELANRVEQLMQQLAKKEADMAADQEEVEALTHDLQKLGAQIFELEGEIEQKDAEVDTLKNDLAAVDKELEDKQQVHEQVVAALKEKLNTTKARHSELTIQHESASTERAFLSSKVEDLALANAKLEEEKRQLQDEAEEIMRALRKEEDDRDEDATEAERMRREIETKWNREVEELEQDLGATRTTVSQLRNLVAEREADVSSLQAALNTLESSNRRQGESASSDRFALELEMDRAKRDLKRLEAELEVSKNELDQRGREKRDDEMRLATAESENKDLVSQLASQTQTRLSLANKHDAVFKNLYSTQLELSSARERLRSLEDQLTNDQRALGRAENEMREQLKERNGLLLTVYQYVDKVGGKKPSGQSDLKPFDSKTFPIFHDRLLERLKGVSQLQMSFERRAKELEGKVKDGFAALKRQSDARHKQLDRFEASIKTATETQRQWRVRVQQKQLEIEGAKAQVSDLQSQLTSARRNSAAFSSPDLSRSPRPGSSPSSLATADPALNQRLTLSQSRVSTLERRLAATQAQLKDAEDKLGEQRGKIGTAEGKWEARFRELEGRVRQAEERTKRERQGAKERVGELMGTVKYVPSRLLCANGATALSGAQGNLEVQLTSAKRRDQQLEDVIRHQQRPGSASSGRPTSSTSARVAEEGGKE